MHAIVIIKGKDFYMKSTDNFCNHDKPADLVLLIILLFTVVFNILYYWLKNAKKRKKSFS